MSDLFNFQTQKDEDNTQIIDKEDKEYDFIIPITFPDYEITVEKDSLLNIKQTIPLFGDILEIKIKYPSQDRKANNLGYSGILIISHKGNTKYYEYGRYDKHNIGVVKNTQIKDIPIKSNILHKNELQKLFSQIAEIQRGVNRTKPRYYGNAIATIYQKESSYKENLAYLEKRKNDLEPINNKTNKINQPYDILTNSCITFVLNVLQRNKIIDDIFHNPHPILALKKLILFNNLDINYNHEKEIFILGEIYEFKLF